MEFIGMVTGAILGAILGALWAFFKKGKIFDIIHYAFTVAIIFGIIGMLSGIIFLRII